MQIDFLAYLTQQLFPRLTPLSFAFHHSFYLVYEKLISFLTRFPGEADEAIFRELFFFYSLNSKIFLDARDFNHFFRLILSIHQIKKKLLQRLNIHPHRRNFEMKVFVTYLRFPYAYKPVMGILGGFNTLERYELFDDKNISIAMKKYKKELKVVKDSFYFHISDEVNLRLFYFEVEKWDFSPFSLSDKFFLTHHFPSRFYSSIEKL